MAAGEVWAVTARVRLDWSDPVHWAESMADCRRCITATHGRDEQGRPVHKWCQEEELAAEMVGQFSAHFVNEWAQPSAGFRHPGGGGW